MRIGTKGGRIARWLMVASALGALSACDALDVDNPAAIEAGDLNDPKLVTFMVNGVVGEFQRAFNAHVYRTGIFSDELVGGHLSVPEPLWDARDIDANHPVNSSLYAAVQAARGSADSLGTRIERLLGDRAATSIDMATVLVYGGYDYILLGENYCSSPVALSEPYTPAQLLQMAVDRFDRALTVAAAAKAAGTPAATADKLIALAHVGAARAYLGMNQPAQALEHATQVPVDFEWMVDFTDNPAGEANDLYAATSPSDLRTAIEPPLDTLGDPRIPHGANRLRLPDGRMLFPPWVPFSFGGWSATSPKPIAQSSSIRLASGLEARYIIAEAGGMSPEALRQFVDERRAVGKQGPFAGTDAQLAAELREQRRRDLYLTAHRLGDLRRYKAQGIDLFPRGAIPGFPDRLYADNECLLIPQSELSSNPKAHN